MADSYKTAMFRPVWLLLTKNKSIKNYIFWNKAEMKQYKY